MQKCIISAIVANLKQQGLNVLNIVNKLKWKTREPLNMCLATFDTTCNEDVKKIYESKRILQHC